MKQIELQNIISRLNVISTLLRNGTPSTYMTFSVVFFYPKAIFSIAKELLEMAQKLEKLIPESEVKLEE